MSRTERLLELIQILRNYRYPVTANTLAEKLQVSVRTVYRDIAILQQQGACIEGEAGMGYILCSDYLLPPLMFSQTELDAIVLGLNWVKKRCDPELQSSASHVLSKIYSVIPNHLHQTIEHRIRNSLV
jgi:predicted DNA-binding transcriptional regulator YafY